MPLNIDIQQILLHMMNFVLLAGGLYILLFKPVKDFMDKRTAYYKEQEEKAVSVDAREKEIEQLYQEKMDQVERQIREEKDKASKEAEAVRENTLESARKEADHIRKEAKEQAARDRSKMIAEAREEIADLAAEAARKLMESENETYDRFLEAVQAGENDET